MRIGAKIFEQEKEKVRELELRHAEVVSERNKLDEEAYELEKKMKWKEVNKKKDER